MPGGLSGDAHFVTLESPAGTRRELLLKRPGVSYGRRDFASVEREFRVLEAVHTARMPAPRPIYLDEEARALAVERLPGAPLFRPRRPLAAAEALAKTLATLHLTFLGGADLPSLAAARAAGLQVTVRRRDSLAVGSGELDEELGEGRIRAALAAAWPPAPNPTTLLHGDFWPGNVLWDAGRISGVVDWEDASLGDPLEDVAIARLDLWWQYGEAATQAFTRAYCASVPWPADALPVWDLLAALRPSGQLQEWARGLDDVPAEEPHISEEHMRAVHAQFTKCALIGLGASS